MFFKFVAIFFYDFLKVLDEEWLALNNIHSSLNTFFMELFLNMTGYTYNYWLLLSIEKMFFFEVLSNLRGGINAAEDWHTKICEDYPVRHSIFIGLDHFINSLLSIYAKINLIFNVESATFKDLSHRGYAELFIVNHQYSLLTPLFE